MDHNSNTFTDGWLKDTYDTTPMFIQTDMNSFESSSTRSSDSRCPVFGRYEDMNPRLNTHTKTLQQHDYFSSLAHSAADLSPTTSSRASPTLSVKYTPTKVTKRKPGRPRTKCPYVVSSSSSTSSKATSSRIPHNQVEQKYRHSLNAEMARLRVAIPKIAEWDTDPEVTLKPSKAMVLASAVKYIRELEKEREMLRQQRQ